MHHVIKDTIVGLVNSLQVIEVEGKELAAKANVLKRRIDTNNI